MDCPEDITRRLYLRFPFIDLPVGGRAVEVRLNPAVSKLIFKAFTSKDGSLLRGLLNCR